MDEVTARRIRKTSKEHTNHCSDCGRPTREGCKFQGCNEVQHCACAMTRG